MTIQTQNQAIGFTLSSLADTERLARVLADAAVPGLTILLDGAVGAGKTTLARAVIKTLLHRDGLDEDVPSPTFTLVQTYQTEALEIWHADLYRLTSTSELVELGLDVAFASAFCLVEWSDRMGDATPPAITIALAYGDADDARTCQITGSTTAHAQLISEIEQAFENDR